MEAGNAGKRRSVAILNGMKRQNQYWAHIVGRAICVACGRQESFPSGVGPDADRGCVKGQQVYLARWASVCSLPLALVPFWGQKLEKMRIRFLVFY